MKFTEVLKGWFALKFQFRFFLMLSPVIFLLHSEPGILGIMLVCAEFLGAFFAWNNIRRGYTGGSSGGTPRSIVGLPLIDGQKDALGNSFFTYD